MKTGNLLAGIGEKREQESFEQLLATPNAKIERIVTTGQATPPGEWYDQPWSEWVFVISGSAGLLIEGETEARIMRAGDYIELPAHRRHRVEWSDKNEATVWLAVHVRE